MLLDHITIDGGKVAVKKQHRSFLKLSGWISLIANIVAITGFLIDRWPWNNRQPHHGFWVVISFIATAYALVLWSTWTWRRSNPRSDPEGAVEFNRASSFLLNALVTLPALTIWFFLLFASLDEPVLDSTLRWILALAVAWVGTPFVAMALIWVGATIGPVWNDSVS